MPRSFFLSFASRCESMPIVNRGEVSSSILPLEHSPLKIGDSFKEGSPLVEDRGSNLIAHAPFGGTVDNIVLHRGRHYYYLKRGSGEDRPVYTAKEPLRQSVGELIRRLRLCGVEDGGDPLWEKVRDARGRARRIVINAVEPEPYFCADTRIFWEHTKEVLLGAEYLRTIINAQEIIIILPKGSKLTERLSQITKGLGRFHIYETELSYPRTHKTFLLADIFEAKTPKELQALLQEVEVFRPSGLLAAEEALLFNKPHTEAVISVDGAFCSEYGNFRLPIGTPYHYFLRPFSAVDSYVIVNGGAMGGIPADPKKGIDKNTRVVLVFMPTLPPPLMDCTHCGLCVEHCPCRLNPIRLYDMLLHGETERSNMHRRKDCIGCNACSCVCPSTLPLGPVIFGRRSANA